MSAEKAAAIFNKAGTCGLRLLARWLHGEAARALGQAREARSLLETTLRDAEYQMMPQVAKR